MRFEELWNMLGLIKSYVLHWLPRTKSTVTAVMRTSSLVLARYSSDDRETHYLRGWNRDDVWSPCSSLPIPGVHIISDVRGVVRQEDRARCDVGSVHPTVSGQHDEDARHGGRGPRVLWGLWTFGILMVGSDINQHLICSHVDNQFQTLHLQPFLSLFFSLLCFSFFFLMNTIHLRFQSISKVQYGVIIIYGKQIQKNLIFFGIALCCQNIKLYLLIHFLQFQFWSGKEKTQLLTCSEVLSLQ